MAKKKGLSRKKLLKEPDEFITFTGRMIRFFDEHKKSVTYGVAAFFLAIVVASVARYAIQRTEKKAFDILYGTLNTYERVADEKDSKAALSETADDFEMLIDKYGGRNAGKLGRVIYANFSLDAGDAAKASDLYGKALDDFGNNPAVRQMIFNGLAYAAEAMGQTEQARNYFERIVDSPNPLMKAEALFNLSRMAPEDDKNASKLEIYKKIVAVYPDSIYAEIAKEGLALKNKS